jgi:hypothetical protein
MAGKAASVPHAFAAALASLCALAGAGCVSADLSKDAKVTGEVVECLPPGTPVPSEVASAIWFPNASGFGSADNTGMGHVSGVVVLAGDKLWFMSWSDEERQYRMEHVVAVLMAVKVEVDHAGTASMLVIESSNRSFDSYELMTGGQVASDSKATQDLCDKIQALRAKHPEPDN